jgi:fumarate hydratase class II
MRLTLARSLEIPGLATSPYRTEKDSMGAMEVPADAYFGAQTRRAELNFEISPLRAPRAFIRALGLIKKAAAQVNMDLGLLNPDLGSPIVQAAQAVADGKHDDQFVVDIFQTGSGTSTNMNTNEVIAGVANEMLTSKRGGKSPVHPNDAVNMGQSSNDVIPTAIHVSALEGVRKKLIPALENLQTLLQARAKEFDGVVKIGRTHLQDAVPIRLGQEFSGYASQVEHGVKRLAQAGGSLAELAIGGTALGTGINTHADFPKLMAEQLNHDTGLDFRPASNTFEAMANRDAAVEVSGAIKTVSISLSNIANNIRWLASGPRCGIGEIRIPELQPGSSIMPGKVNPVIPEAVMMVGAQVVGNDATIAWANALGSNFDLNVMMPVIAYNLLQSIDLLTNAAKHLADKCVDAEKHLSGQEVEGVVRIEADKERCRSLIELSLAMCTALAPRIGYDVASKLAKRAYKDGINVRPAALEWIAGRAVEEIIAALGLTEQPALLVKLGVPSAAEIEALLEPYGQTVRGTGVGGSAGG